MGYNKIMSDAILIVEDDSMQRHMLCMMLKREGRYIPIEAEHGREALDILNNEQYQKKIKLVVMDIEMPIMGGIETLAILSEQYPDLPVIILTAHDDPALIVNAIKLGAIDFITKPYEPKRVMVTIQNAIKLNTLSREVKKIQRVETGRLLFSNLIGADGGLKTVIETGRKAAQSNIPVLITGETGVGKELFASAIHGESARAGKPFIAINCGAIPQHLVESVLFGHEKGSFTGATNKTLGKFREADGGTIFLDEVGELPRDTQVKLLRVLQQKEIEPVGAAHAVKVDVRIISATNRDLSKDIQNGHFREDLYFRLNVLNIHIPALRERGDDILNLARHFMNKYCSILNKPIKTISSAAERSLQSRFWHGNVRELENTIYREIVLNETDLIDYWHETPNLLSQNPMPSDNRPQNFLFKTDDTALKTLDEIEYEAIMNAMNMYENDVIKAANALGVAKSTLYRKLEKMNITR